MNKIPFFNGYDSISKKLTLKGASYFPEEIFDFANEIEILDLSEGSLKELPNRLPELNNLKIIFCSRNLFTEIPAILAECVQLRVIGFKSCKISHFPENCLPDNLRWLILSDNCLTELPKSIGNLSKLQKLALTGNQLARIPEEMNACQSLELLRLSANSLKSEPPAWLFNLPRLAWYADSGNLFQLPFNQSVNLSKVPYEQIKLLKLLGESPSSEVWEGIVDGFTEPLAIKKYKGKLTSDGYIIDDLQSCIQAGTHDNIIAVRGQIISGPNESAGLILQLIPSDFKSLGLPPSLETCTRDTFAPNISFTTEFIFKVLKNIASAVLHLHEKGMTHGDLYAHNILTNVSGHCFLGDFGAASRYDPSLSRQREYVESRAFGYLIDDLLLHCSDSVPEFLSKLKLECLSLKANERPLMKDIITLFK